MKTLLEDYQRRLATAEETIKTTKNSGSINDQKKMERLNTKAGEYRAFIVEIERAIERENGEPKSRLDKLCDLSFADLKALQAECIEKMEYNQRRIPKDKKLHKNIYDEMYPIWLEWYSLHVAVDCAMREYIKNLNA